MARLRFLRDSAGYAAAQFAARAILIARTLVAVRVLGPQGFGAWSALQLLMDYGSLAPMGTQQGLDLAVPSRIVDGDEALLARVKRAGLTSTLLLSLLYSSACLAYFLGTSGLMMVHWGLGGLLLAMAVVIQSNWAVYAIGIMRSHGHIGAVSRWYFLQGIVGGLLGLALVRGHGEWGLLWGWVAGNLVAFLWSVWDGRRHVPWKPWIGKDTLLLFQLGLPMFIFVGSSTIIRNLDRLIIVSFLGTRELGYYSLAVTALTLIQYLPDSVTFVFYPRLVRQFRGEGSRPESVREVVLTVLRVLTVFTPFIGGVASLFVRHAIEVLVPNFEPAIEPIRIMCFTAAAVCVSSLASVILMTLGQQIRLIPLALVSIGAFALADRLALQWGYGITGVAWATMATYLVMGLVTLAFALRALRMPGKAIAGEMAGIVGGLLTALVLGGLLDRFAPWANAEKGLHRVLHVACGTLIFVPAYLLVMGSRLRGLGIRRTLAELDLPFFAWLRRVVNLTGPES